MRILIVLAILLSTSACSTIGNLEPLNDWGSNGETVRVTAKTINKTMSVLGYRSRPNQLSTSRINSGYGNAKSGYDYYSNKNIKFTDTPSLIQEVQDFLRYLR